MSPDPINGLLLHVADEESCVTVDQAIEKAAGIVAADHRERALVTAALCEREQSGSTQISPGVFLPHAVLPELPMSHLVVLRPPDPSPSFRLLIGLVVGADPTASTLAAIRRLMRALADEDLLDALATDPPSQCRRRLMGLVAA